MLFFVFQQRRMHREVSRDHPEFYDYSSNLVPVAKIHADTGVDAIAAAKKLPVFRAAVGLGKFPIVQPEKPYVFKDDEPDGPPTRPTRFH